MYVYTPGHSRVLGTGVYIPELRITTRELMQTIDSENRFGVSHDWLEKVTGIKEKRLTPEGILPSDMAVIAANDAMERARITPLDVDAIIYTGLTRDYLEPATAHIVQAKLKATNAIVFDITNACNGFMNGIHVMDALIATGQVRRGLVVTGEQGKLFAQKAVTTLNNLSDRKKLIELAAGLTLGDAGAAMVLGPKIGPDTGFMGFMLQSQGQYASFCTSGGPMIEGPLLTDMPAIVSESARLMTAMFYELMHVRLKWKVEELAKYVIHQVGVKVFKFHSRITGIPIEIMPETVIRMGNLVTANIPVSIHQFVLNQDVRNGDKIYLSGTGSGISLSQAGLVWEAA